MKTLKSFIVSLLLTTATCAQIDPHTPWVWMKGDNNPDQYGNYGASGNATNQNKPGGRVFSTTWKDINGNLWLFGGMGRGASEFGYLNDMWKFNIETNNWSWIKGDSTIDTYSVYGTKGVAHTNNKPGSASTPMSWTDANGTLWLFGGFGFTNDDFGFLNTLWKYDPVSNQWTWVHGDKTIDRPGVYGTKGVEHSNNRPGARYGANTWTDASGHLWLFGGYGYDNANVGMLNDVWKYNPSTNRWTWVSGDKFIDKPGVYGTKGVASPSNTPGSRYVASTWADGNGNLWLYGGYGFANTDPGMLSDMWKYNMSTNQWTWMQGDNTLDQQAAYGIKGTAAPTNKPGARYIGSSWVDKNKELWLFGGYGNNASSTGYLNDFWKFSPSTNEWVWIKGDTLVDQTGIYGTQGTAAAANKSGARNASVSWADMEGNLWLFGGYGYDDSTSGSLNDLWKISSLNTALPLHLLGFSGTLHEGKVKLDWKSEHEVNFSHFNIQRSFNGIDFTTIGKVNGSGNSYATAYDHTDHDLVHFSNTVVFYRLQMMDDDGTFEYSKILRFDLGKQVSPVTLYPNPASSHINLAFSQETTETTVITIAGMNGAIVKSQSSKIPAGRNSLQIDVSTLPAGNYILSLQRAAGTEHLKFVRQ